MTTIALVACCKSKRTDPAPAHLLYTSALFQGAARYAQAHADVWFILSAKHGLVSPGTVLEPYEMKLSSLSFAARRTWATQIADLLYVSVKTPGHIIMIAGSTYRKDLVPLLLKGFTMDVPMAGLRLGQQLAFLKSALHVDFDSSAASF